jgi:hypothetical protein
LLSTTTNRVKLVPLVIPVIDNAVVVVLPEAFTLKVVPPVKFLPSKTLLFRLFVPS